MRVEGIQGTTLCNMPAVNLSRYFLLLRRVHELLFVLSTPVTRMQFAIAVDVCQICFESPADSILDCEHSLCEQCEKRWCERTLVCPYCRKRFRNTRDLKRDGWHVAECSKEDLLCELRRLKQRVAEFWRQALVASPPTFESSEYIEFGKSITPPSTVADDFVHVSRMCPI